MRARWWLLSLIVVVAAHGRVHAQSASAQAQSLFDEGQRLVKAGKLAEACAAFDSSQKLDPAVTTLLNLADCREQNHQLATAWGAFVDANRMARSTGNDKLARVATTHARKLEPRLSKLTISVPADHQVPGLDIARGADRVDPAGWNHALPIDGGTYTITARAPGRAPWSTTRTIKVESDLLTIEIPKLLDAKAGAVASGRPGSATPPAAMPPAGAPPAAKPGETNPAVAAGPLGSGNAAVAAGAKPGTGGPASARPGEGGAAVAGGAKPGTGGPASARPGEGNAAVAAGVKPGTGGPANARPGEGGAVVAGGPGSAVGAKPGSGGGPAGAKPGVAGAGGASSGNPGSAGPPGAGKPGSGASAVRVASSPAQPGPQDPPAHAAAAPSVADATLPPDAPRSTEPSDSRPSRTLPLVVGAGAVVLAGAALGFDLWGDSIYNKAKSSMDQMERDSLVSRANTRRYTAEGFGIAAIGCAGAAVYLYLRHDGGGEPTAMTPMVSPQLTGLAVAGSW
jgi:hypothetical protein